MSKRLRDNITSGYVNAANALRPRQAKRKVVAYVESYDDVFFWRSILSQFETEELHFEVMLPSHNTLGRGKKSAIMNVLGEGALGECMIACVDADYDYLMQGATPTSRTILESPYIFHTYVYAIENFQCYSRGLHTACVMATLNDREVVNLEEYIQEYSRIIWPLFVWNVWAYRHGRHKEFSMQDFEDEVSYHDVRLSHLEDTLAFVRRHVNRRIGWLQQHFREAKKTYAPLRDELLNMGLTPETTYLYMQGHTLMEGVVLPLLQPICSQLRRERENEIRRLACHERQRQNELSCYQHSVCPIEVMLKKSTVFFESDAYSRLKNDLEHAFGRKDNSPKEENV